MTITGKIIECFEQNKRTPLTTNDIAKLLNEEREKINVYIWRLRKSDTIREIGKKGREKQYKINKIKIMHQYTCKICGKEYFRERKSTKYKYCSEKCKKLSQLKYPPLSPRKCDCCGREYMPKRIHQHFCSKPCWSKMGSPKAKLDPWKGSFGCQICDFNKYPCSLEFHHHIGKENTLKTFDPYNIPQKIKEELKKTILICANCHRAIHNRKINESIISEKYKKFQEKIKDFLK